MKLRNSYRRICARRTARVKQSTGMNRAWTIQLHPRLGQVKLNYYQYRHLPKSTEGVSLHLNNLAAKKAGAEVPRALHDQEDPQKHTRTPLRKRNAKLQSRTGNLWRFVPSCSQYREQEQLCSAKLGEEISTVQLVTINKKGA